MTVPLEFQAIITCGGCGEEFEGYWTDDSITEEDMTNTPVADQPCGCGYVNKAVEWPGWMHRSEAG